MARLSKSRFCSGLQCHKKLWLEAHEPDARELEFDPVTRYRLDVGTRVGTLARRHVPNGTLIDLPHDALEERLAATRRALAAAPAPPAVYEATFQADDVSCAVDILERLPPPEGGHALIEVKSTTSVKDEHLPDVAVQAWVLRRCGVDVRRMEVMHLNPDCRAPNLVNLFVREDVTRFVEDWVPRVEGLVRAQRAMLEGDEPPVPIGPYCFEPRDCPFIERCWKDAPEHHVTTLFRIRSVRAWELVKLGHTTILDLPADHKLNDVAARQVRAVGAGALVVEPGLPDALARFEPPVAYLDFETVGPAVPVWPGCAPYAQVPVQFSCHVEDGGGTITHREWLADGAGDPRPALAQALVAACRHARTVVMYTPFERTKIRLLALAVPGYSGALAELETRLLDLEPVVRHHVYHPAFGGSFGLKAVLPALVPEVSYDGLAVADGALASVRLEELLLGGDRLSDIERARLRKDLLAYCAMDTRAMVKLVERLRILAAPSGPTRR